jgi:hypothetical protein
MQQIEISDYQKLQDGIPLLWNGLRRVRKKVEVRKLGLSFVEKVYFLIHSCAVR